VSQIPYDVGARNLKIKRAGRGVVARRKKKIRGTLFEWFVQNLNRLVERLGGCPEGLWGLSLTRGGGGIAQDEKMVVILLVRLCTKFDHLIYPGKRPS